VTWAPALLSSVLELFYVSYLWIYPIFEIIK